MLDLYSKLEEDNQLAEKKAQDTQLNSNREFFTYIFDDNADTFFAFLVDWNRGMRVKQHWNPDESKMEICDEKHHHRPCEGCKNSDRDFRAKKKNGWSNAEVHYMPAYCLNNLGQKRKDREGNDTEYDKDSVVILPCKPAKGKVNWKPLMDANGDPYQYYPDFENSKATREQRATPDLDLLSKNELMYTESGDDQFWKVTKMKDKSGTTYTAPSVVSRKQIQKDLGAQTVLRVPSEVRDRFNSMTLYDLAPHYLACNTKVDWEAWGLKPPVRPDDVSVHGVDASAALS